jgi:hypothetical protein
MSTYRKRAQRQTRAPRPRKSPAELALRHRWSDMIGRCYNPHIAKYRLYGALGVVVCDEWRRNPEAFVRWSIDNGYAPWLQIDRINPDGPYCPANCRWVTARENARNRRTTHKLSCWGETKSLSDWSEDPRCAAPYRELSRRWKARDEWSPRQMLETPPSRTRARARTI